jgi:hypothetical protein
MTLILAWMAMLAEVPVICFMISMLCDTAIILALIFTHKIHF